MKMLEGRNVSFPRVANGTPQYDPRHSHCIDEFKSTIIDPPKVALKFSKFMELADIFSMLPECPEPGPKEEPPHGWVLGSTVTTVNGGRIPMVRLFINGAAHKFLAQPNR